MKHLCECGRTIHLSVVTRSRGAGVERRKGHSLCLQCYKRLRNKTVAARMLPKPSWAYAQRATLALMQQRMSNDS